jgi:hypothetical protein
MRRVTGRPGTRPAVHEYDSVRMWGRARAGKGSRELAICPSRESQCNGGCPEFCGVCGEQGLDVR